MADSKLLSEPWFEHNQNRNSGEQFASNDKRSSTFEEDVREVMRELGDLLIKKHKDYGPLNIANSPGGAINGLRVRMWDKLARINNLHDKGATAQNEPFEDSFKDLANYGIIGLLVLRHKWGKE